MVKPLGLSNIIFTKQLEEWLTQNEIDGYSTTFTTLLAATSHYYYQYSKACEISKLGALKGIFDLIEEEQSKSVNKFAIKCAKGCFFCCHLPVMISSDEAEYINYFCKENNVKIKKTYLQKQLKFAEKAILRTKFSACVFLSNNECSIYPARPLNCRKHLVISNPALCDTSKTRNNKILKDFNFNIEAIISAVFSSSRIGRLPELLLPFSK